MQLARFSIQREREKQLLQTLLNWPREPYAEKRSTTEVWCKFKYEPSQDVQPSYAKSALAGNSNTDLSTLDYCNSITMAVG